MAKLKRKSRKQNTHTTIILNPLEVEQLEKSAKLHGIKLTKYIKQSALAYNASKFLVPHPTVTLEIKQIIFSIHNQIEALKNREVRKWFGSLNDYETLKQLVTTMFSETAKLTQQPNLLVDSIKKK